MIRRVAVVTGTRAEYGLLAPLMEILKTDPDFELRLIVTGTHLSERFGMTVRAIEADGFAIDARVPLPLDDDSPRGIIRAMAAVQTGIAEALEQAHPDVVVMLGDRYEILAAAEAAFIMGYPIAHIHGGETTEGAMDDGFRHAITKLSYLHFVTAEPYRRRVIQMGESPDRVMTVGAPGLDVIERIKMLPLEALERELGFVLGPRYFLVTYHPETMDREFGAEGLANLLAALDEFPDHKVVVTGQNADPGYARIASMVSDYAAARQDRVLLRSSLGQQRYLNAMKHCAAVVGNSSSGVIEAPALGVPTVNIGDRQKGRLRAKSVVDCAPRKESIVDALHRVNVDAFRNDARRIASPYGSPGASARIADVLRSATLAHRTGKPFFDLNAQSH